MTDPTHRTAHDGGGRADRPAPLAMGRHLGSVQNPPTARCGAERSCCMLIALVLLVLAGPLIYWNDPQFVPTGRDFMNLARHAADLYGAVRFADAKVNWLHPLGTDNLGRDILGRLLIGGRISLAVGLDGDDPVGASWHADRRSGGLFQDRSTASLMRLTDLFLALPLCCRSSWSRSFCSATACQALFGPEGGTFILIVTLVGITSWMQTARIVRGDVLALKEREFVLAARSIGTSPTKMITRHLLPNVMSPIMVSATLGHRHRHHHRIRAFLPRFRLPAGLPDLGQVVVRQRRPDGALPRTCPLARPPHFTHRAFGELCGRRAARCPRSADPRPLTPGSGFAPTSSSRYVGARPPHPRSISNRKKGWTLVADIAVDVTSETKTARRQE